MRAIGERVLIRRYTEEFVRAIYGHHVISGSYMSDVDSGAVPAVGEIVSIGKGCYAEGLPDEIEVGDTVFYYFAGSKSSLQGFDGEEFDCVHATNLEAVDDSDRFKAQVERLRMIEEQVGGKGLSGGESRAAGILQV